MFRRTRGWPLLLLIGLLLAGGCDRSPEAKKARHLERGDRYFKKEQYREAVIEYRNVLRIEPTNPRAFEGLGLSHYQLGEAGQAFRYLLKAQELNPNNVDVRLKLGTIYLAGRRPEEAEAEAAFVLEKDPKNLEALILLAGAADTPEELAPLADLAGRIRQNGAIWVVSRKGKSATIRDVQVIEAARSARLVDNKVVSFSPTHTALRLVIPRALRSR